MAERADHVLILAKAAAIGNLKYRLTMIGTAWRIKEKALTFHVEWSIL
jgi:hypothetical protein